MITGFNALLGDLATVRPIFRPLKDALPVISYRRISTVRSQTHDGPTGLKSIRYQFTVHSKTELEADIIGNQVADRCDGLSGDVGGTWVDNAEVSNQFDLGYLDDAESFQYAVDVIFHTKE